MAEFVCDYCGNRVLMSDPMPPRVMCGCTPNRHEMRRVRRESQPTQLQLAEAEMKALDLQRRVEYLEGEVLSQETVAELQRDADALVAVNDALGADRATHPFVDDAVRHVVQERNTLRRALAEATGHVERLRRQNRESAERKDREHAERQKRLAHFENLWAEGQKFADGHLEVDWSKEEGATYWGYSSVNNRSAIAALVERVRVAEEKTKRMGEYVKEAAGDESVLIPVATMDSMRRELERRRDALSEVLKVDADFDALIRLLAAILDMAKTNAKRVVDLQAERADWREVARLADVVVALRDLLARLGEE